jgi:putative oxidoreductase
MKNFKKLQRWLSEKQLIALPVRLVIGFGFAAHGYAKLSRGPESFAKILQSIGMPFPQAMAWVTSLLELFGGIMIMAGAFILFVSIPLAVVMFTAMLKIHLQFGFSSIRLKAITSSGPMFGPIGYELNLIYLAGLLTLVLAGSGGLSIDHYLHQRSRNKNVHNTV